MHLGNSEGILPLVEQVVVGLIRASDGGHFGAREACKRVQEDAVEHEGHIEDGEYSGNASP